MTQTETTPERTRAKITVRTLRQDPWWRQPAINFTVLTVLVIYLAVASLVNRNYFWNPYISPLYSPCLVTTCTSGAGEQWIPWLSWLAPAVLIIWIPMGFRLSCYYYRKAYYRAFWRSPAACAVREPHARYTGETRFPLILQNLHRYFFWIALILNIILTWDAVIGFRNHAGTWGHAGLGTLVLVINACLLWLYSLSCHACRHALGGRLRNYSKHPARYWVWTQVSKLNTRHMQIAWVSLVWVAFTDLYIRLVASGAITDLRFF